MKKLILAALLFAAATLFTPKALAVDPCCKYTIRYAPGSCYTATLNNGSITDGQEHAYADGDWAEATLYNCANNCNGTTVFYVTGWHWVQPVNQPGYWVVASGPYPLNIAHTEFDVKFHLHGYCSGYPPLGNCMPVVWGASFDSLPCYRDNCGN